MTTRTRTTVRKPAAFAVGAALAALALAGCGSTSSKTATSPAGNTAAGPSVSGSFGPPASGPHNAQDTSFVTDMLPHHGQAVVMADMALGRDTTPQVKALARQIKDAQAPEITAMSGWLAGWGEHVPADGGMGGHSTGGMTGTTGMMDADRMNQLDMGSGTSFARMWLAGMTEHHSGAVDMARREIAAGQNTDAKALAARIVSSQTAEIATMKGLLAGLH